MASVRRRWLQRMSDERDSQSRGRWLKKKTLDEEVGRRSWYAGSIVFGNAMVGRYRARGWVNLSPVIATNALSGWWFYLHGLQRILSFYRFIT